MKWTLLVLAAMLAGCATAPPDPAAAARQHERNITTAQRLGYEVVTQDGQTQFCKTRAPVGSHIVPPCMTETAWEQRQNFNFPGGSTSATAVSGRPSQSGTLGY